MFEKEAEEYLKAQCQKRKGEFVIKMPEVYIADISQSYKDGAEFGYNKANEWHYPSKGELPKVKTWVIGFYYGKDNWHKIFYRADGNWWGEGQLCQPPFAWKEIVLPKESK